MITLTKPIPINSTLGADDSLALYDHVVLGPITVDPIAQRISANVRLTSTASPGQPEVIGDLSIIDGKLSIEVGTFGRKQITLTTGQGNAAKKVIDDAQNALENGLISLDAVKGVHTPGV